MTDAQSVEQLAHPRWCSDCATYRADVEFPRNARSKDGLHYLCNECNRKRVREHKAANRQRMAYRSWAHKLKRWYGITPEVFHLMWERQQGKCAICGTGFDKDKPKSYAVDHCHATGKARALLCGGCNWGLGCFRENPQAMAQAIRYIEHFKKAYSEQSI